MSHGAASHRLRKKILFMFVKETGRDFCFQCGSQIEHINLLSIEHKAPWMSAEDPKDTFFDLDNIAFSHLSCNIAAGSKPNQKYFSKEERLIAKRKKDSEYRKTFTPEQRRERRRNQYLRTGN